MREFLKGGKYLGDAAWAQDETGYNYREMYQMATTHGDAPANTNLELVLDASSLHLLGTSEAGTGKTLDFAKKRQRIHQLVPSSCARKKKLPTILLLLRHSVQRQGARIHPGRSEYHRGPGRADQPVR